MSGGSQLSVPAVVSNNSAEEINLDLPDGACRDYFQQPFALYIVASLVLLVVFIICKSILGDPTASSTGEAHAECAEGRGFIC